MSRASDQSPSDGSPAGHPGVATNLESGEPGPPGDRLPGPRTGVRAHPLDLSSPRNGARCTVYFREEVVGILKRRSQKDRELFHFLVLATIVTGVVGFPLFAFVELASLYGEVLLGLTGVALISTGLMQRGRESRSTQSRKSLGLIDGLTLGIVQGLAAIPGLSRSGVITTALIVKGFSGKEAFRVSFLMSIPAVFAAAVGLAIVEGIPPVDAGVLVALVASFISALASIDLVIKLAQRTRFSLLCIILGIIAILAILPAFF